MSPSWLAAILTVPWADGRMPPTVTSSARSSISLTGARGLAGQLGGGGALDVGAELAAEAAAHVMGDALDARRRDLEMHRQRVRR